MTGEVAEEANVIRVQCDAKLLTIFSIGLSVINTLPCQRQDEQMLKDSSLSFLGSQSVLYPQTHLTRHTPPAEHASHMETFPPQLEAPPSDKT